MLTSSSNQYLRPDYLNPLPTTLDAKKSPLALLAQTCSQIGADPSSTSTTSSGGLTNKSSTSSSNNNNNESNSSLSIGKSKSTNSTSNKSHHHDHRINSSKTLPLKKSEDASAINSRSSNSSCGGGQDPMSTEVNVTTFSAELDNNKNQSSKTPCSNNSKATTPNPSPSSSSSSTTTSSTPTNPTNKSPSTLVNSSSNLLLAADSTLSSSKSSHNVPVTVSFPTVLSSGTKLNHTTNPSNFSNTNSSLDLIGFATKHGNSAFPFPGLYPPSTTGASSTTLAPYLHSYARLKAASANDPLLPPSLSSCRDPFCNGCQLGQGHGLKSGFPNCPIGCLQCDHVKTAFPSSFGFIPGFPLPPSLANLYSNPHNAMQPYVCNWVVGDSYCLKRFSSPDDLLIHLKTHTSPLGTSNQEALQSLAAAAAAAGYPPLPFPSHSMLFSPAAVHGFLSRTYPTPPISPLGTSRFHPYSKTGSSLSPGVNSGSTGPFTAPGFSPLSHPAFSPYYPYSLYSQRLGGASSNGSLHP